MGAAAATNKTLDPVTPRPVRELSTRPSTPLWTSTRQFALNNVADRFEDGSAPTLVDPSVVSLAVAGRSRGGAGVRRSSLGAVTRTRSGRRRSHGPPAGRAAFEPYGRLHPTLVEGTTPLARMAAAASVEHIVYGSSMFVYDGSSCVDGRSIASPKPAYGQAKLHAEDALTRVADAGGPTVASIRLPHVYGPQSLLFGLVRQRRVLFPGPGNNPFARLPVHDAARVLIEAAIQRWSGTTAVADKETVTWNEFFATLTTFAPDVGVLGVSRRLATSAAAVGGALLGRFGPTMVLADTVKAWNLSLSVTSRTLWSELGIATRYPSVVERIPATLDGRVAFRWRHPLLDRSWSAPWAQQTQPSSTRPRCKPHTPVWMGAGEHR